MDEELMYGARIELYYTYKVTNIGEIDYLDNQKIGAYNLCHFIASDKQF